jgi:molybdenum cofactor cytidylyltransferase
VTTGAVVLAAGGSTRFDGPTHKLLTPFRGRPLVAWAFDNVLGAGFELTAVVTGAADLTELVPPGVEVIENPAWAEGQASSLQAAVRWGRANQLEAIVVGLADQPLVGSEAWRDVGASTSPIAVASFDGVRCPPTRLAASVWPLLPSEGDQGARVVMAGHPELVEAVACHGQPIDIDTAEDFQRWS